MGSSTSPFPSHLTVSNSASSERTAGVLGGSRQDLAILRDRLAHALESRLEHLTESVLRVEDRVGRRGDLHFLAQNVHQLAVAAGALVEAIERLQCLRVASVDIDHQSIAHDGGVDVLERDLVDLRERSARSTCEPSAWRASRRRLRRTAW